MKNNRSALVIIVGAIGAPLIGLSWALWVIYNGATTITNEPVVIVTPAETPQKQPTVRLKRADCQTYQCLEPRK